MNDKKKSVEDAIYRYYQRQNLLDEATEPKPKRKNDKPEKVVEDQVLAWCRSKRWSVDVVESKAVFSAAAGRYLHSQVKKGFSDVVGCSDNGLFIAIELKAPGRISTLRDHQREYLIDKINKNCFAVVVDSVKSLEDLWLGFCQLKDRPDRQAYLLDKLPKKKESKDKFVSGEFNF